MRNLLVQIHWKYTNADYNGLPIPRPSRSNENAHCPPGNGIDFEAPGDGSDDVTVLAVFGHVYVDDGDDDDGQPVAPQLDWARHESVNWHAMWHASLSPLSVPYRDAYACARAPCADDDDDETAHTVYHSRDSPDRRHPG